MIHRILIGASVALALFAAACTGGPPEDGVQKTPEGPQFDASYYAKNAKEYFDEGRYGQAKDQWMKQLQKDPDNWMAHLGIAYSDLYVARQSKDMAGVRAQVVAAEKRFRGLWSGEVEPDTLQADPKRPQWKAAMGLALSMRTLGYLDQLESQKAEEILKKGGPEAAGAANRVGALQVDRDQHYREAIGLFNQLAHQQHASPDAIKHLGDLYVATRQDALAEQEYTRYLDMASRTREELQKGQKEAGQRFGAGQEEVATAMFEEKIESNAQKQVSVRVDLAQLGWARGDYLNAREHLQQALKVEPDRKDLYLKLAEVEAKLDMDETAIQNVDEFLKRSSRSRSEFDNDIRHAMKLKQELEQKLKNRGAGRK